MKKFLFSLLVLVLLSVFWPTKVLAESNKVDNLNNKFGIHLAIVSKEDLKDAANLVNSSGGDWGYVTVVIQENDRNLEKWQENFDEMRRLHLIPIVRLATSFQKDSWQAAKIEEADSWANFLNSLNWVVKKRYVVLFNEPNFAKEWGGKVDAASYGLVALKYAQVLKEKNQDFFLMLAGFDYLAPHQPPNYETEANFIRQLLKENQQEINNFLVNFDGWASHSYQPETYLRELEFLRSLGLVKKLPVFITEAGWPHAGGVRLEHSYISEDKVSRNLLTNFTHWTADQQIMAITPFVLNYQGEPFDHFSWRKISQTKEFYSQYQIVQSIEKIKGNPPQEQKLVITNDLPKKLISDSTYQIPIRIRNEGQAVWDFQEGYQLQLVNQEENFDYFFSDIFKVSPFSEETIWLYLKTKVSLGKFDFSLAVSKDNQIVSNHFDWKLEIVPAIDIKIVANFFPGKKAQGRDFKFLIYDSQEEVIFQKTDLEMKNGIGNLTQVHNLTIGEHYRLVLLKPYYLPRQNYSLINESGNEITFPPMLPVDFSLDGKLSWQDLVALIKKPRLLRLWLPF